MNKNVSGWLFAGMDAWMLGAEASLVAGMRLARIAAGGTQAVSETQLMLTEKVQAAAEWQMQMLAGGLGTTPLSATNRTLRHYRGKVAASRRRLAR